MAKAKYSKDKQGRYYIDRSIGGKRCNLRAKTQAELDAKLRAWLDAQAHAQAEQELGPLFEEVAAAWWEAKYPTLKHGTVICYRPAYHRALDAFSGRRIDQITPDEVAQYIGQLVAQGFAGNTIANSKSVLNMIFSYWRFSAQWPGYKPNPVTGYQLPPGLPKTDRLPPSEQALQLVRQHREGFGYCPAIFSYTGMRLGEVNALQWKDIDFTQNIIHIYKSTSWHGNLPVVGTPKTKNSVRDIPLLEPLRQILLPIKGSPNHYVLSGAAEPLTQTQYKNRWTTYCKALGLVEQERVVFAGQPRFIYKATVTAHQFRHDFASNLYEAGIGEKEAQLLLGHADIATTHRIYTHVRKHQMDEATNRLNAFFTQTEE